MQTKDIISKQTIGHLAGDIATLLLGLDIDTNSVELLDTEQQRVEIRRADLVARMHQRVNGTSFILHLEIQNSNDAAMPLRMMRYYTDIKLEWAADPIMQYLIYIGRNNLTMPDPSCRTGFHLPLPRAGYAQCRLWYAVGKGYPGSLGTGDPV